MNPKIFILLLVCTSVALACDKKDVMTSQAKRCATTTNAPVASPSDATPVAKARTVASADLETFRNVPNRPLRRMNCELLSSL
ncbi:hypothetical protein L596_016365 [Steinernema carpocapsae]|uniref:Lipoprotein n=1 Tax=Steinernema carpocapsae TaxID=34508 RepID=A0A4U5NHR9_STECR|nr:hypothetical protein L596_016365 [Steinernema carpocapsae]